MGIIEYFYNKIVLLFHVLDDYILVNDDDDDSTGKQNWEIPYYMCIFQPCHLFTYINICIYYTHIIYCVMYW